MIPMWHFLNLTNGLEDLDSLDLPSGTSIQFLRITSTAIEQDDWFQVFSDIDHNLLLRLALGHRCIVWDRGCRRPISKTISVGIPIIRACLAREWLDTPLFDPKAEEVYESLFVYAGDTDRIRLIRRKYRYYRKFVDTNEIRLEGRSAATEHDGDMEFYRDILQKWE
jgi:hypothetical protein